MFYSESVNCMPGGWSAVDTTSPDILDEVNFAMGVAFPNMNSPSFKIVKAMKQVVAGINYDVELEITPLNDKCFVHHFLIYDRFGSKTMAQSNKVGDKCGNT